MGYDNRFTGAITITPPLTWAEIRNGPGVSDVRVRIVEDVVDTDTGQTKMLTGNAIEPLDMTYSGHTITEDIQTIVDYYGPRGHTFAGHIQVQWDPGFEDPTPQRYIVVDGRVETVTPTLVWPGEATARPAKDPATPQEYDCLCHCSTTHPRSLGICTGTAEGLTVTHEYLPACRACWHAASVASGPQPIGGA